MARNRWLGHEPGGYEGDHDEIRRMGRPRRWRGRSHYEEGLPEEDWWGTARERITPGPRSREEYNRRAIRGRRPPSRQRRSERTGYGYGMPYAAGRRPGGRTMGITFGRPHTRPTRELPRRRAERRGYGEPYGHRRGRWAGYSRERGMGGYAGQYRGYEHRYWPRRREDWEGYGGEYGW